MRTTTGRKAASVRTRSSAMNPTAEEEMDELTEAELTMLRGIESQSTDCGN